MPREITLQNKIKRALEAAGAVVVVQPRTRYGRSGVSDLLVCFRGRFIAIEVKSGGRYGATKLQSDFLERVRNAGGIGVVSTDVAGALAALEDATK